MDSNVNKSDRPEKKRWTVYSKQLLFLAPAAFVWVVTAIFIAPKLKQIWANAGGNGNPVFAGMDIMRESGWSILIGAAAILVLVEKFWTRWPRYRKHCIATLVFGLNFAVLLSLMILLVTAVDLMVAAGTVHFGGR